MAGRSIYKGPGVFACLDGGRVDLRAESRLEARKPKSRADWKRSAQALYRDSAPGSDPQIKRTVTHSDRKRERLVWLGMGEDRS